MRQGRGRVDVNEVDSIGAMICELLSENPENPANVIVRRLRDRGVAAAVSEILGLVNEKRGGAPVVPALAPSSTGISERASDHFDNDAKTSAREANLAAVLEAPELWADEALSRLRVDWCELMGETGMLTLAILERARVLRPGGFVGVDLDIARIERFRAARPDLKWIGGDLHDALDRPELGNVGILNYDGYEASGAASVDIVARHLRAIARRSLARYGCFMLIWNTDLTAAERRKVAAFDALREQARVIAEIVVDADPRRRLTADMILPPEAAKGTDLASTNSIGRFQLYRGTAGGHRMAIVRVLLR